MNVARKERFALWSRTPIPESSVKRDGVNERSTSSQRLPRQNKIQ